MRLRWQLLLVSLLTLVIPWAGCRYIQEIETALRDGQESALLRTAEAVAGVLENREDLLYRQPGPWVFDAPDPNQVYATRIPEGRVIDGYRDDWTAGQPHWDTREGNTVRIETAVAIDSRYLYALFDIRDDVVLYPERPGEPGDALLLRWQDPAGDARNYRLSTLAPGSLTPVILPGSPESFWDLPIRRELTARAFWQETPGGYSIELRVPLELIGARFGYAVFDRDDGTEAGFAAGTLGMNPLEADPGRLAFPIDALEQRIDGFAGPGIYIEVADRHKWKIAEAGTLRSAPREISEYELSVNPLIEGFYRTLLSSQDPLPDVRALTARVDGPHVTAALDGSNGEFWHRRADISQTVLTVASPVRSDDKIVGAVVASQTSEEILTLANRALVQLVNLTFITMLVAVAGLLGFATWLSLRIRRLSRAATHALSPEGQISTELPGQRARDELGDMSRSFATLLGRVREYNAYLRTLADKLSHELRTPLTVVSSSLEHLEDEQLPESAAPFARRAREGTDRLKRILSAMSEATRLEQSIQSETLAPFDIARLVRDSTAAYADIHPRLRFECDVPFESKTVAGSADLVAQMLDKLVDNAVDFTPAQGLVRLGLGARGDSVQLSVANEGPLLPEKMRAQLFDSMVSVREGKKDVPHLGLGLYMVRLIAEFHGGQIEARNWGERGAEFVVTLPAN